MTSDFDPLGIFSKVFGALEKIEPGKRALVRGAVRAANNDHDRTKRQKAEHIAKLFHVKADDVEELLA